MATTRIDLTGKIFGKLKVINYSKTVKNRAFWNCLCECGNKKEVPGQNLRIGKTRSCGCATKKFLAESQTKHGMTGSLTHNTWLSMLHRCNYESSPSYKYYGGKGIKVCDRWKSFENFYLDMGNRPSLKHSLDRIDYTKNYEPSNCKWSTFGEQALNKSTNKIIEYNGIKKPLTEWALFLKIPDYVLFNRLKKGWSIYDAFNKQWKQYNKKNRNRDISRFINSVSDSADKTDKANTKDNSAS